MRHWFVDKIISLRWKTPYSDFKLHCISIYFNTAMALFGSQKNHVHLEIINKWAGILLYVKVRSAMDTAIYVKKHTGARDLEASFYPHPHRLIPKFWMYE